MPELRKENKGPTTAGYPSIEKLIDSEDFSAVNEAFEAAYSELEEISKVKRGLKRSREAKKAMRSIELVMNLFKELLEIKYRLQEMLTKQQAKKA